MRNSRSTKSPTVRFFNWFSKLTPLTDQLGYEAVDNKVSVTDWHATILNLLGLDYQRLVFDQNGLKEKLTSVFEARLVKEIME